MELTALPPAKGEKQKVRSDIPAAYLGHTSVAVWNSLCTLESSYRSESAIHRACMTWAYDAVSGRDSPSRTDITYLSFQPGLSFIGSSQVYDGIVLSLTSQ